MARQLPDLWTAARRLVPRRHLLLPLIVVVTLVAFFAILWIWSRHSDAARARADMAITAEQVATRLESFIAARLEILTLMAALWRGGKINTEDEFAGFVRDVEASFDGLLAINWIDTDGIIRWVVPEAKNRAAKGKSIADHPVAGDVMRASLAANAPRVTPPVELFQGGLGVAAYLPLTRHGVPDGFLDAVFRIEPLVVSCLQAGSRGGYAYAVRDGDRWVYTDEAFDVNHHSSRVATHAFHVGNRLWNVTLERVPGQVIGTAGALDTVILGAGCLLAMLLGFAVWRDLRRRDALELRTAELQAIHRAHPDLQFRLAADGTILDHQADAETDLYVPPEQFIGRRMQDVLPAEVGALFTAAFRKLAAGTPRVSLEYELQIGEQPRHFEARILPLPSGQMIVIARDITARKRVQDRLEIVRFAVDQAALPVYWVRVDGRIAYVNAAACRTLGYSREELERMSVHDIDPDFPQEMWAPHWKSMREKGAMTFGAHHRRRDGTIFPVQITTSFLEHQGVEYVWAFVEDTSDRQRVEAERVQLERQLRQAQKLEAVGQLAGGIAHEFNNLLTVILGCTELMLSGLEADGVSDDPGRQNLGQIQTAGLRASDLTRQLLAFSRRNVESPSAIDTSKAIAETGKMLEHLIRENVTVDLQIPEDLEPIQAGSGRLEQVLVNLVVNASDAMPDGGHLRIDCASVEIDAAHVALHPGSRTGRHVRIEVADDGVGMSAEDLEHMFEPFYTTKPVGKGTGLGMATVYAFVTQVGGHIVVESEPGRGTTVQVYFPAASSEAVDRDIDTAPAARGQGESILVCEDETAVREVICDTLRTAGYDVLSAENSAEALDLAARQSQPVTVLVTDVVMPEMNGPKLAETMAIHHPALRVLFISGYPGNLLDPDEVRARGHDFLSKPFSPGVLQARVRRLLDTPPPASPGHPSADAARHGV